MKFFLHQSIKTSVLEPPNIYCLNNMIYIRYNLFIFNLEPHFLKLAFVNQKKNFNEMYISLDSY